VWTIRFLHFTRFAAAASFNFRLAACVFVHIILQKVSSKLPGSTAWTAPSSKAARRVLASSVIQRCLKLLTFREFVTINWTLREAAKNEGHVMSSCEARSVSGGSSGVKENNTTHSTQHNTTPPTPV